MIDMGRQMCLPLFNDQKAIFPTVNAKATGDNAETMGDNAETMGDNAEATYKNEARGCGNCVQGVRKVCPRGAEGVSRECGRCVQGCGSCVQGVRKLCSGVRKLIQLSMSAFLPEGFPRASVLNIA